MPKPHLPLAALALCASVPAQTLGPRLALFPSPASTPRVLVVDDDGGPGVDHTTIEAAVAAARTGDLIEVRAGGYGFTTIDKAVTLMGEPGVNVIRLSVTSQPSLRPLVITDLRTSLVVSNCAGPVVFDNSSDPAAYAGGLRGIDVTNSGNVWLRGMRLEADATSAITIHDSTVFMEDVVVDAPPAAPENQEGAAGIDVTGASLVTLSHSDVLGGTGGCSSSFLPPGDGGPGLAVRDASTAYVLETELEGGIADTFLCPFIGSDGPALAVSGSARVVSTSDHGLVPSAAFEVEPDFPVLDVQPSGTQLDLTLHSAPGSVGRVFFGGRPALSGWQGAQITRGCTWRFGDSLGFLDGQGEGATSFDARLLPRGSVLVAQGSRTLAGGQTELSAPVLTVIR
ncbi:MAG: hypothetical protein AAFU73_12270 [Planctomycetota bacterium]